MLIEYSSIGFLSAITLKRGSARSLNGKDFAITVDTTIGMVEVIDKGTENGIATGRYKSCAGERAHVPVSNMLMGLDPINKTGSTSGAKKK